MSARKLFAQKRDGCFFLSAALPSAKHRPELQFGSREELEAEVKRRRADLEWVGGEPSDG